MLNLMDYFKGKFILNNKDRITIQKNTLKYFIKNKKNIITPIPLKISNPKMLNNIKEKQNLIKTKIDILQGDTLSIVCRLMETYKKEYSFLVMANSKYPGGGWKKGASAQEENICRRSNLPFVFKHINYPIKSNETVLIDMLTIIKDGEKELYAMKDNKIITSCLLSAAPFYPSLNTSKQIEKYKSKMKERIKIMLRSFYNFDKKRLVLGAWGCGAFKNPPNLVAKIFNDVLHSNEFNNKFEHIVFAILDGVYSNNYYVFKKLIK